VNLANQGRAAPGVARHHFQVAAGIRVARAPAQRLDRQDDRRQGIVQFVDRVGQVKGDGGGGADRNGGIHGLAKAPMRPMEPGGLDKGRDYWNSGSASPEAGQRKGCQLSQNPAV
jgi:hypothetical protein